MTTTNIFEGLEAVYRAGARTCRCWPMNAAMTQQAEVYDAMADEAQHQAVIADRA